MIRRTISIFILLWAVASFAFAQTKQISANEFYTANSNAQQLMRERSWRTVMKTDTQDGTSVAKSISKIHEKLLPDRERFLVTEKIGDRETRSEYIRIGFMEYRRENNEPWISKDLRGTGSGSGSGMGNGAGCSCVQYTEESDAVEGVSARRLRQLSIEKNSDGLSFDDMSVWLDQNGLFLKTERVKGLLEPRVEKTRSVMTYEYDPKITIEAPIK